MLLQSQRTDSEKPGQVPEKSSSTAIGDEHGAISPFLRTPIPPPQPQWKPPPQHSPVRSGVAQLVFVCRWTGLRGDKKFVVGFRYSNDASILGRLTFCDETLLLDFARFQRHVLGAMGVYLTLNGKTPAAKKQEWDAAVEAAILAGQTVDPNSVEGFLPMGRSA